MTEESNIQKSIKWGLQIITLGLCIIGMVLDFLFFSSIRNEYELFWYLLGSGIVSLVSGLMYYFCGKPKTPDDYGFEPLFDDAFNDANEGHFLGEVGGDILKAIPSKIIEPVIDLIFSYFDEEKPEGIDIAFLINF